MAQQQYTDPNFRPPNAPSGHAATGSHAAAAPPPEAPPSPSVRVTPPPLPARVPHEGLKSVLSTLAVLVLAPVIALLLTMFVFQSYEVEGQSMETTLQNRDRLIIVKVPRTMASITGHNYIPNRGDVIVFNRHAGGIGGEGDRQLIKRVVGLPGERVVVQDGKLTVFNTQNPKGFSPDTTLPYGSAIHETPGSVDKTVAQGEIFVAGDNRSNSLDSRYFGPIATKEIVGKLGLRIYPFNKTTVF
jgi:signal peptidase I